MIKTEDLKCEGGKPTPSSFFNPLLRLLPVLLFLFFLSAGYSLGTKPCLAQQTTAGIGDERILTGTGTIINNNIALARDKAISEAFSKALEGYLVMRLGSDGMARDFQRLDEEILSKAKEVIQDYQMISEFRTDRYVKVLMKIRVNEAVLEEHLKSMGLLEGQSIEVAVLFMVSETKEGAPTAYWWGNPSDQTAITQTELSLSRIFEQKGFRVINRSFYPPEGSYDEDMLDLNLRDAEAVKWGKLLSAQTVITGEANVYDPPGASVFLRAIRVVDGAVIAQGYRKVTLDASSSADESAIETASNRWANDMVPYIIAGVSPEQESVKKLIISITGFKSFGEFLLFSKFLKNNFPEIESALETSLRRDLVRVAVKIHGDAKGLSKKILDHPEKPFEFEIYEVSELGFTVNLP